MKEEAREVTSAGAQEARRVRGFIRQRFPACRKRESPRRRYRLPGRGRQSSQRFNHVEVVLNDHDGITLIA